MTLSNEHTLALSYIEDAQMYAELLYEKAVTAARLLGHDERDVAMMIYYVCKSIENVEPATAVRSRFLSALE